MWDGGSTLYSEVMSSCDNRWSYNDMCSLNYLLLRATTGFVCVAGGMLWFGWRSCLGRLASRKYRLDCCNSLHLAMYNFLRNGGRIDAADSLTVDHCEIRIVVGFKQLGHKQVGFKQLGHKQVGFKQLGPGVETRFHGVQDEKRIWFEVELQGAQEDREAEVFQVSNDDAAVAQRELEDKQPEEKTNMDCLVMEQEKVHLGTKVGANITVTVVPGQEGAKGNVAEKKKMNESMKSNLRKLLEYKAWLTRRSSVQGSSTG
ncbi:hypothetical protein Tco_0418827 [Tanacetum coccineum]